MHTQENMLTVHDSLDSTRATGKEFLPITAVHYLIHCQSVQEYWERLPDSRLHGQCSDVVNYVCVQSDARCVFAIIILIDEPWLLHDLIRDGVCDNDLPLSHAEVEGVDFQLARKSSPTVPVKCFGKWSLAQRRLFDDLQRQVKTEVLEKWPISLRISEISERSILPLTKSETIHTGNSRVDRVEIHHAHHRFHDFPKVRPRVYVFPMSTIRTEIKLLINLSKTAPVSGNSLFALKVLKAEDANAFALEVKALMKIKPKPHLVTAVTAFKYQEKYHLVFKWAEGGNLADFWGTQAPSLAYDSVCWLAQQCHGLADGLDGIHNASISLEELENDDSPQNSSQPRTTPATEDQNQIHGRHGDIKPQNILWFSDEVNEYSRGVLKITDFGVTAFHTARTTKVLARYVQVTRTYAAPEVDVSEPHCEAYVSRPFDIWSLGCVYLEFITWILLGNETLKEFARRRSAEKGTWKKFQEDNFYSVHKKLIIFGTAEYATVKKSVIRVSSQS